MRSSTILFVVSAGITAVTAKTDLTGCTSTEVVAYGGASLLFWDPTDDEICSFLDCGGGTAPPKTTVPGCPAYSGTATYTPDYLSTYIPPGVTGYTPPGAAPASTPAASPTTTTSPASSSAISSTVTPITTAAPLSSTSVPVVVVPVSTAYAPSGGFSSAWAGSNATVATATLGGGSSTLTSTVLVGGTGTSTNQGAASSSSAAAATAATQTANAGMRGAELVKGGLVVALAAGVGSLL